MAVLTVEQAAQRLGVTTRAVRKWIRKGRFPNAYKLDPYGQTSPFRIPIKDIEAFEASRKLNSK